MLRIPPRPTPRRTGASCARRDARSVEGRWADPQALGANRLDDEAVAVEDDGIGRDRAVGDRPQVAADGVGRAVEKGVDANRPAAGGPCQGRAASKAADACSTVRSANRRPTICRPTGKPDGVSPAGTVAAGCWVKLKG